MRLWIERLMIFFVLHLLLGQPRMRLWIESFSFLYFFYSDQGQPRMRLWIERTRAWMENICAKRSASYEAVNWKVRSASLRGTPPGQPRMRLWIERLTIRPSLLYCQVSLVWGCELKESNAEWTLSSIQVSLVWGCELKEKNSVKTW